MPGQATSSQGCAPKLRQTPAGSISTLAAINLAAFTHIHTDAHTLEHTLEYLPALASNYTLFCSYFFASLFLLHTSHNCNRSNKKKNTFIFEKHSILDIRLATFTPLNTPPPRPCSQLNGNALVSLDGNCLGNLQKLRSLRLEGNLFYRIPTNALAGLRTLEAL